MNGSPSVKVALFIRNGGSESPCRWFYIRTVGTRSPDYSQPELLLDTTTGELRKVHIFTTTLGFSSLVYAEIFLDEKLPLHFGSLRGCCLWFMQAEAKSPSANYIEFYTMHQRTDISSPKVTFL